jgi:hypothetical protein
MTKLIIVLTNQRHSSSFFCNSFAKLENVVSGDEFMNVVIKRKYPSVKFNFSKSTKHNFEELCKSVKEEYITIKLFKEHINKRRLQEIAKLDIPKKFIILKRKNIEDAYKSLVKATNTGNWGITPEMQEHNKKNNISQFKSKITIPYESYKKSIINSFKMYENTLEELNIDFLEIQFEDVINDKVNYEEIVRSF